MRLVVIVLLLVLLLGGLGLFVARVFLFGLLIALLVGVVGGDAARAALRARISLDFHHDRDHRSAGRNTSFTLGLAILILERGSRGYKCDRWSPAL